MSTLVIADMYRGDGRRFHTQSFPSEDEAKSAARDTTARGLELRLPDDSYRQYLRGSIYGMWNGTTHKHFAEWIAGKGMKTTGELELREEVRWFAELMELQLQRNDHKGGWKECSVEWLLKRLLEEAGEVYEAYATDGPAGQGKTEEECADVANFALMIAEIVHQERV